MSAVAHLPQTHSARVQKGLAALDAIIAIGAAMTQAHAAIMQNDRAAFDAALHAMADAVPFEADGPGAGAVTLAALAMAYAGELETTWRDKHAAPPPLRTYGPCPAPADVEIFS